MEGCDESEFPQLLGASVQSEMGNSLQKLQWVGTSWLGKISWVLAQPWLAWVGTGQPADRHTHWKAVYAKIHITHTWPATLTLS